ncbi:hypothetical protein C8J57DRAFT_1221377 [Mycena rebaudengoi]|nr:hypothetical protein C8J57DRAFT_1221377 [Mycena rebaudengoi]
MSTPSTNVIPGTAHSIAQGDPAVPIIFLSSASAPIPPNTPLPHQASSWHPPLLLSSLGNVAPPLSRGSTMSVDEFGNFTGDVDLLSFDDVPALMAAPVTAPPANKGKGKGKASSTAPAVARGSRAPPTIAEAAFSSLELSQPTAPGTRWSVSVANTIQQDAHSAATLAAQVMQPGQEHHHEYQAQFEHILAQLQVREGTNHTDDGVLAGLTNGHNNTVAIMAQLQEMVVASADRLSTIENSLTAATATLGEANRALTTILTQNLHLAPAPIPATPAVAPSFAAPPALAQAMSLPPAPVHQAYAPVTIAAPIHPTYPAIAAPGVTLTAPLATTDVDTHMGDMQAAFTAAMQASFATLLGNKHGRDDDDQDGGRNVHARSDIIAAGPVASTSSAPAAPEAPTVTRRTNDPACKAIFGPVRWKSDINSEARAVIAEGMTMRPNLCSFFMRRGPDSEHIICGFDTPGATGWFIDAWMAHRSGKWAAVIARPNA